MTEKNKKEYSPTLAEIRKLVREYPDVKFYFSDGRIRISRGGCDD